jgi:rhomboid protease GluP
MNHYEKKSILCPGCRRLISRDEPACPYCGLHRPGSRLKGTLLKLSVRNPEDIIKFILYTNIGIFLFSLLLNPTDLDYSFHPFQFLSPSSSSLLLVGATGTIPIDGFHRWWTIFTASFVHGGILHILFNMVALWQLSPFVLQEYGMNRFTVIYLLSGVGGFLLSYFKGIPFTLGASASICGLIGAILYYGKSRGGFYGQMIYRQAMGWIVGLILFGLLLPSINNWAHGGGIIMGIVTGFLLGYDERKREGFLHKALSVALSLVTSFCLAGAVLQALYVRFF